MRDCGTCTACCRWPKIPELYKSWKTRCQHLKKVKGTNNCTIHPDRPPPCQEYKCSWLRGHGDEEHQPDQCGVLIDARLSQWGKVLVAKALRPGACQTEEGMAAIMAIGASRNLPVIITHDDDADLVVGAAGHEGIVNQIKASPGPIPLNTPQATHEQAVQEVLKNMGINIPDGG